VSIYTRRIVGPAILAAATEVVWTCPANTSAVIRNVLLVNSNTAVAGVIRVGIGGTTNATRFLRVGLPVATSSQYDIRVAMTEGEELWAYSDTNPSVSITVTAFVFDDP